MSPTVAEAPSLQPAAVAARIREYRSETGGFAYEGLRWPVDRVPVSSSFGPRRGGFHKGVDLDTDYGAEVRAAHDGTVTFAGRMSGYGRLVEITDADGVITRYAHLSVFADGLSEGQEITAGEPIGQVGTSGYATGSHLHFELEIAGDVVDPMDYLAPGQEVAVDPHPIFRMRERSPEPEPVSDPS